MSTRDAPRQSKLQLTADADPTSLAAGPTPGLSSDRQPLQRPAWTKVLKLTDSLDSELARLQNEGGLEGSMQLCRLLDEVRSALTYAHSNLTSSGSKERISQKIIALQKTQRTSSSSPPPSPSTNRPYRESTEADAMLLGQQLDELKLGQAALTEEKEKLTLEAAECRQREKVAREEIDAFWKPKVARMMSFLEMAATTVTAMESQLQGQQTIATLKLPAARVSELKKQHSGSEAILQGNQAASGASTLGLARRSSDELSELYGVDNANASALTAAAANAAHQEHLRSLARMLRAQARSEQNKMDQAAQVQEELRATQAALMSGVMREAQEACAWGQKPSDAQDQTAANLESWRLEKLMMALDAKAWEHIAQFEAQKAALEASLEESEHKRMAAEARCAELSHAQQLAAQPGQAQQAAAGPANGWDVLVSDVEQGPMLQASSQAALVDASHQPIESKEAVHKSTAHLHQEIEKLESQRALLLSNAMARMAAARQDSQQEARLSQLQQQLKQLAGERDVLRQELSSQKAQSESEREEKAALEVVNKGLFKQLVKIAKQVNKATAHDPRQSAAKLQELHDQINVLEEERSHLLTIIGEERNLDDALQAESLQVKQLKLMISLIQGHNQELAMALSQASSEVGDWESEKAALLITKAELLRQCEHVEQERNELVRTLQEALEANNPPAGVAKLAALHADFSHMLTWKAERAELENQITKLKRQLETAAQSATSKPSEADLQMKDKQIATLQDLLRHSVQAATAVELDSNDGLDASPVAWKALQQRQTALSQEITLQRAASDLGCDLAALLAEKQALDLELDERAARATREPGWRSSTSSPASTRAHSPSPSELQPSLAIQMARDLTSQLSHAESIVPKERAPICIATAPSLRPIKTMSQVVQLASELQEPASPRIGAWGEGSGRGPSRSANPDLQVKPKKRSLLSHVEDAVPESPRRAVPGRKQHLTPFSRDPPELASDPDASGG